MKIVMVLNKALIGKIKETSKFNEYADIGHICSTIVLMANPSGLERIRVAYGQLNMYGEKLDMHKLRVDLDKVFKKAFPKSFFKNYEAGVCDSLFESMYEAKDDRTYKIVFSESLAGSYKKKLVREGVLKHSDSILPYMEKTMSARGLGKWANSSGSYRMYTATAMDLTDIKIALTLEGLSSLVYKIFVKDENNGQYRDVKF